MLQICSNGRALQDSDVPFQRHDTNNKHYIILFCITLYIISYHIILYYSILYYIILSYIIHPFVRCTHFHSQATDCFPEHLPPGRSNSPEFSSDQMVLASSLKQMNLP